MRPRAPAAPRAQGWPPRPARTPRHRHWLPAAARTTRPEWLPTPVACSPAPTRTPPPPQRRARTTAPRVPRASPGGAINRDEVLQRVVRAGDGPRGGLEVSLAQAVRTEVPRQAEPFDQLTNGISRPRRRLLLRHLARIDAESRGQPRLGAKAARG